MVQKSLLLLLLSVGIVLPLPSFGLDLSLDEALKRVEESPSIEASRHQVGTAQADADMAKGMFYPNLQVTHGYMYTNNPVGVFSSKLQQRRFTQADFGINLLNDPDAVSHWQTRFQVMQPILNSWIDIKNMQASKFMVRAGEAEHQDRTSRMRMEVEKLYWTIVALENVQGVYEQGIDRLRRLEKSYQLMEAPTSATTTNFLITQSVRFDLEARLKGIESGTENAKNFLLRLLDLSATEPIVLTDGLPEVGQVRAGSEEGKRADLLALEKKVQAAQAASKAKSGTWLPRLDFVAGYNLFTGNYSFVETAYDLGVQLKWDVFVGPRIGQIRKAKREEAAAKSMHRALSLQAEAEKENAYRNLESRTDEFELIREAKDRAESALKIARKRYRQGTLPLFDYSQAIQNWVQVQEALVMARKRVSEAQAESDYQRGAL